MKGDIRTGFHTWGGGGTVPPKRNYDFRDTTQYKSTGSYSYSIVAETNHSIRPQFH